MPNPLTSHDSAITTNAASQLIAPRELSTSNRAAYDQLVGEGGACGNVLAEDGYDSAMNYTKILRPAVNSCGEVERLAELVTPRDVQHYASPQELSAEPELNGDCERCGESMATHPGDNPTRYCDHCAQELVVELQATITALNQRLEAAEKQIEVLRHNARLR